MPYSAEELRAATLELVARNGLSSCYIRPIVYRGYGTMGLNPLDAPVDVTIACWEWGAYLGEEGKRNGVRAKVSSWERISPRSLIPHAKASGQYLNSVLAKVESVKAGYEEAILLDEHGHVCEGTGENVYVVRDGEIATPGQHNSILDGITRRSVIQIAGDLGYEIVERNVARAELYLADEVFMSGTAAELVPVREIDDHPSAPASRARSRACCRPPSTTRSTDAPSATASGSTWSAVGAPDSDGGGVARGFARHRADSHGVGAMADIELYDATLRDGMGGGGMTLTAAEKLRVVHALDALGVHMIEAGFPSSNPKEQQLFELLAEEHFETARDRRFRDDAPPRRGRGRRTRGCGSSRSRSRRCARSSARARFCTSRRSCASRARRTCAMIGESVAFLVARRQARAARRRALLRRLRARPRLRARLRARRGRRGR